MYSLVVHDHARKDLDDLWTSNPEAAARIEALLEEIAANPELLNRLLEHGFGQQREADFEIQKWFSQWRQGRDLWRLKVWAVDDLGLQYRIIYAYHWRTMRYHVLAVVHRDFDYDESHKISQRVLRAYYDL